MLTIRKEQMDVLSAFTRQNFENRVARYLRETYPEQFTQMGEPAAREQKLSALIAQGIDRARRYGLEAERDVAQFIEFMVRIAPNFEDLPELKRARAILSDKKIPPHGRVELIHHRLGEPSSASAAATMPGGTKPEPIK